MMQDAGNNIKSTGAIRQNVRVDGFSMVELTAALGIFLVLLTIGVPSFSALIRKNNTTTIANDFFAAMNLARSEAIHRGVRVDLVPAGDGSDWTKGWLVFIDRNNNQKPDTG